MFDRVGEEDREIDHRIVERITIWLILQKFAPLDPEDFEPNSAGCAQHPVDTHMGLTVGEADHRLVAAGLCVDALRVFRRDVGEDLDLCAREAVTFRMRIPYCQASAIAAR